MSVMEHVIAISDTTDIVNEKVETAWSDTVVFVTDSPKIMWDEGWAGDEKQLK